MKLAKAPEEGELCLSQATMSSKPMAPPHVPICCRGSIKVYNDRHGGCREILKVNGSNAAPNPHSLRSTAADLWSDIRQGILKTDDYAVEVSVGGQIAVKMPARFARYDWQHHQPEAVAAVVQWVRQNPAGLVLDIGPTGAPFEFADCAGIYSLIALAAGPQIEVVAFDSDVSRLARIRRLCDYARGGRLRFVYGFIRETSTEVISLSQAIARTDDDLRSAAAWGGLGMLRYDVRVSPFRKTHFRSLDQLFLQEELINRPMLIRSQLTWGQLGMLRGAQRLLKKCHPCVLLTVDPQDLRAYGHSREEIQRFLESEDYEVRSLAVGDEEHWWCRSKSANAAERERPSRGGQL
jgi:hypothetical protein